MIFCAYSGVSLASKFSFRPKFRPKTELRGQVKHPNVCRVFHLASKFSFSPKFRPKTERRGQAKHPNVCFNIFLNKFITLLNVSNQ